MNIRENKICLKIYLKRYVHSEREEIVVDAERSANPGDCWRTLRNLVHASVKKVLL